MRRFSQNRRRLYCNKKSMVWNTDYGYGLLLYMDYIICSSLAAIFLSTILKIVWTHKILNPLMQASFIWFLLETKLSARAIFEGTSCLHTSFCLPILLDFGGIYRLINRLRQSYPPFSVFSKLSCTNVCKWIVERSFYKRTFFFPVL